jgi:hypothetical protein
VLAIIALGSQTKAKAIGSSKVWTTYRFHEFEKLSDPFRMPIENDVPPLSAAMAERQEVVLETYACTIDEA